MADQRFSVEVAGQRREYGIDTDRITGDEAVLIEELRGVSLWEWGNRLASGKAWATDLLLAVFLAARREQAAEFGSPVLDWREFVATIDLSTFEPVKNPGHDTEPKPSGAKSARSSSSRRAPETSAAATNEKS